MSADNRSITILAYQYSVVVRGIENKLKGLDYRVTVVTDDYEILKLNAKEADLFITYLPDDIAESIDKINNLHKHVDMMLGGDANLLFIGENKYHNDLLGQLPILAESEWVNRPIDMEEFTKQVERLVKGKRPSHVKKRILIIDDDSTYAKMVAEWINKIYKVDIVTAGMQAISFLLKVDEKEPVDLILLDYEMPVVDGPQVLQMLRQEPTTENIPIIFLTGNGTKEAVSRVMSLKPNGYLLKSTPREDIIAFLRKRLG